MIEGAIHNAAGALANASGEKARFTPGTTLNKRYRIVGLLGKGGMGEVYCADDLKLGHPVALKFLTEKLSQDQAMLARFHGEVAMAHRVTHPNVCRVHDIGEVTISTGKLHFLSMEYVDGEDLSSLLRRIGRLPADKAKEWLAFGVALIIWTSNNSGTPGFEAWLALGLVVTFQLVVLVRFGLLALVAYNVSYIMIQAYPLTSDFTAWFSGGTIFALGVVVALCGYGF